MSITLEAAYHEAGHAIVARRSKFHSVVGDISLADYGAGENFISVSRSKLTQSGKAQDSNILADQDVAADYAVVLSAGLIAERLAEERLEGITADPAGAAHDYGEMQKILTGAGLPTNPSQYEQQARQLLEEEWDRLVKLAESQFKKRSIDAVDFFDFF